MFDIGSIPLTQLSTNELTSLLKSIGRELQDRLEKALDEANKATDEASRLRYPDTTGQ